MASIRNFFQKRKLDFKFMDAGKGQKLSGSSTSRSSSSSTKAARAPAPQSARAGPSSETQTAAMAAMTRVEQKKNANSIQPGTGSSAIKAQVRREMEKEKKAREKADQEASTYAPPTETYIKSTKLQDVTGVFYRCPIAGPAVLPKDEMDSYIEDFLITQLASEPEMTSSLMIHTLNKDKEKVAACVDILTKYLDNIMKHPGEEKYCKIRVENKAFQERVAPISGSVEYLQAAGFEQKSLPSPNVEGMMEDYLVFDLGLSEDIDRLQALKDVLATAEPIKPEVDPDLRVYRPSQHAARISVPDSFYAKSTEEIKREHQRQQEACERLGMLRTKEMREREQTRELRRYRFTLIRVRLPDGMLLQGTFRATAQLSTLRTVVEESIREDLAWVPFALSSQTGHRFSDTDNALSLAELGLAPAAVVNFTWDQSVLADIQRESGGKEGVVPPYLNEALMSTISSL